MYMTLAAKWLIVSVLCNTVASQATTTVTNAAAGSAHSVFLKSDGSLWAMGGNFSGQLGDGTFNQTNRPEMVVSNGVVAVSSGANFSLFLKSDGSLWTMGDNQWGQLGNGMSGGSVTTPQMVVSNSVTAIAGGFDHALFIKSDGSLWGMGHDLLGALGDGNFNSVVGVPEQTMLGSVVAIAAGQSFSLVLKSDQSLWGMGRNDLGQLGDCTFVTTNQAQEIISNGVVAVAAGYSHSLFLKSDGSLWGMGDNSVGELGPGNWTFTNQPQEIISNGVVAIAAGQQFSLFLKSDNSLWAMGANGYGQLGDGVSPGNGASTHTNVPELILSNGVAPMLSAGGTHTLFVRSDGSLWGMGNDFSGQLGGGFDSQNSSFSPVPVQITPLPPPSLTVGISQGTNVQVQATVGFAGTFCLLANTNILQPMDEWTPLLTNTITTRGSNNFCAIFTNGLITTPWQFYFLRCQ